MKTFSVEVEAPAAKAHLSSQRVTVDATSWATAIGKGVREILKRDGIKGKRHEMLKVTIRQLKY